MLGSSFAAFLSLENKGRRTLTASLVYIVVNILLNWLFVQRLHLEAFGLAQDVQYQNILGLNVLTVRI